MALQIRQLRWFMFPFASVAWLQPAIVSSAPMTWEFKTDVGPPARGTPRLAFDTSRHVSVLFGGYAPSGAHFGDTWEWDGNAWLLRNESGPSPRSEHAMAFDQARGLIVLFGGNGDAGVQLGDTWVWDGSTWSMRDAGDAGGTNAPAPRHGAGLAFDSKRNVTVLFGGRTTLNPSGYFGDTWEWNGAAWTLVNAGDPTGATAPAARAAHSMSYDNERGVVVIFSGGNGTTPFLEDTWEWNGSNWTKRCDSCGPLPRGWAQSVYAATQDQTILFGGGYVADGSSLTDTWAWNGSAWTQLAPGPGPTRGLDIGMCYDSHRGVTVLVGGRDLFTYEPGTWELGSPDSDNDGVPDSEDTCENSDLSATVVINTCNSGVNNQLFVDSGCSMMDLIDQCQTGARNHGQFVSCVTALVNVWRADGIVTGREGSRIVSCAGKANRPLFNKSPAPAGQETK